MGTDYVSEQLESVPLGCVSLTRRFFPDGSVDPGLVRRRPLRVPRRARASPARYREAGWKAAIGTSGTAKSLWQVAQADLGEPLTPAVLASLQDALLKAGHPDRLRFAALKPDRRPVLPGGLAMLGAVFEELGVESMDYCDGALREGVLYDLLGRSSGADMREVTVARMVRRHGLNRARGGRRARVDAVPRDRPRRRRRAGPCGPAAALGGPAARDRPDDRSRRLPQARRLHPRALRHAGLLGGRPASPRDPGARPDRRAHQAAPASTTRRVAAGPVPATGGDAAPPPRRAPAAVGSGCA